MKFCSVALIASTATAFAFAPSKPPRTNHHQGIIIRTQQSPRLRLLPDPDLANLVTDSAFSSSSITTSNFIDGLLSDVGGFLLIASVGAGVYSNTLQEKQKEFQDKLEAKYMKKTDDAVITEPVKAVAVAEPEVADPVEDAVEEEEPEVVEEEEVIEAIEEVTVTEEIIPTPAPVPPTSELVLKETEKAIAEVKAKGVQETKAKMSFNEPALSPPSPTPEQVEEPKKDVVTKKEKDPGTKKQIAQGITLIVAAAGVALARNVIKAWLGRGMF